MDLQDGLLWLYERSELRKMSVEKRGFYFMENVEKPKRSFIMQIIMGGTIAVLVSLLLSLLFSFIIVSASLGDGWLGPIKQVTRVISILLGCFLGYRGKTDGWKKGLCLGLVYSLLAVTIFSLIDKEPFAFNLSMLWDVLLGTAMGVICGIITVNIKRK